jgi:hypothetical protein
LGFVADVVRRHAELLMEEIPEVVAMRTLRRHLGWYLHGYPVGDAARVALRLIDSRAELHSHLDDLDRDMLQKPGADALPRGRTDGPHAVVLPEGWLDLIDDPTPPRGTELVASGG